MYIVSGGFNCNRNYFNPIIPEIILILGSSYYSFNYSGIIGAGLVGGVDEVETEGDGDAGGGEISIQSFFILTIADNWRYRMKLICPLFCLQRCKCAYAIAQHRL